MQDNPIYVNTEPPSQDPSQNLDTQNPQQWMARHDNMIIDFYESKEAALDGMHAYQMDNVIDMESTLEVRQII
jgi:hypothetical protein